MTVQFYVDKVNATFADSLTAFGLTEIVYQLLETQVGQTGQAHVRLVDFGAYNGLDCHPALDTNTVAQLSWRLEPAPLVETIKNTKQLAEVDYLNRADYEQEKQRRNIFLEFLSKAGKAAATMPADQKPAPPHRDWDIYRAINPAALPGYNNLLIDWAATRSAQAEVLALLLNLFSTTPNDVDQAMRQWKALDKKYGWGIPAETTTLQLYNPDQGKGQNRAKANALGMGNVKGFWLLEFLKAIGLYHAGLTRTLRGVKDRKTYVIAPKEIDFTDSNAILKEFRERSQAARHAIGSDIMAAVNYVRSMLQYAQDRQDFLALLLGVERPRNLVSGFYTAFYKDLGNAVATMNLSFIALPNWIQIHDDADVQHSEEVLNEIERLTRTIDESRSEGHTLLSALRDFVSGSNLNRFFDFTTGYAGYYMGLRERKQYAHQLSIDFVRSVVVGTDERLAAILENPGFKNIAYAIGLSTVIPQYRKTKGDKRYDIRYGLGQELARKARYPKEFVTALAEFLHKYNAENAQVYARYKAMGREGGFRRKVKPSDIDEIVKLVDEYGSPLIANLLIAYGYARFEREQSSGDEPGDQLENDVLSDTTEENGEEGE